MDPLIFYEKNLPGGSEPNEEALFRNGTINLDGREDLKSMYVFQFGYKSTVARIDGEHFYDDSGVSQYPYTQFDLDFWRSSSSEISYKIKFRETYKYWDTIDNADHVDDAFIFRAEFETGDYVDISIPFTIMNDYNDKTTFSTPLYPIRCVATTTNVPKTVDWDFGNAQNIYVPGNQSDPWRYQTGSNSNFDPENTCWGVTKDAAVLLRVYEDAIQPESTLTLAGINPSGYGIRNNKANQSFDIEHRQQNLSSIIVSYDGNDYSLSSSEATIVNMADGKIKFEPFITERDQQIYRTTIQCSYELNNNVNHADSAGVDVLNKNLTLQAKDSNGNVATKDILVQIVDDAPFVRGDATMDLSGVEAWTLGGYKLPLSYDYLKDVLYRSTDYNDWATGFKVTNCEGKYGSIGVFGDDGNPDDPASAPGNTYYMPDQDKIAFVAPGETVTEAVQYTYTDSDGDAANGVLNIVLNGTGLNPAEAIKITPRPGNVPTSGGDVPSDNPYVPGNPDDPYRDLTFPVAGDYDPMNPNWGLSKNGYPLLRVFESGLPNGSEPGQRNVTAHGYLDIDATVGLQSIVATTDGLDSYGFEDNMMAIPLDGGTLTLTQNPDENYLKYEFTLTDPVTHISGNGINSKEQGVKLYATDKYGNEEVTALEVQIIDDVPVHSNHSDRLPLGLGSPAYMWHDTPVIFPISEYFCSADFIQGNDSYSIEPPIGKYGTFDVIEGSYEINGVTNYGVSLQYTTDSEKTVSLKSDEIAIETFKYTYTDADGDSAEGKASILIPGPGVKPHFTVYEADLANGCEIEFADYEIIGPENLNSNFKYGTISQDSDGVWRYKLVEAMDSGSVQGSNVINVPNEIGMWAKTSHLFYDLIIWADVDIIDSVPTFTAAQNRLAYDFGADNGPGAGLKVAVGGAETDLVPGVETMIAGQHGLLALSADGSCNYTPNSDAAGIDRFDFTIIDSDGDRALASIEASVQDGTPQMAMSVQDADSLAAIAALGVSPETGALAGA